MSLASIWQLVWPKAAISPNLQRSGPDFLQGEGL